MEPDVAHYLELFQCESTSISDFCVVPKCGATYNRSYGTSNRPWGNPQCLLSSRLSTSLLPTRLVEPGLDETLPVFVEMAIGDHVVVFGSHVTELYCLMVLL